LGSRLQNSSALHQIQFAASCSENGGKKHEKAVPGTTQEKGMLNLFNLEYSVTALPFEVFGQVNLL